MTLAGFHCVLRVWLFVYRMILFSHSLFLLYFSATTDVLLNCFQPQVLDVAGFRVKRVAAGDRHSAVLTSDGQLWCCGENEKGQCGTDSAQVVVPVPSKVKLINFCFRIWLNFTGLWWSVVACSNALRLTAVSHRIFACCGRLSSGCGILASENWIVRMSG